MITVTDTASKKIKTNLEKRGGGLGIRVGVRTTGCSGLAYVLEYVDALQPGDIALADNHTNVIVDKKSLAVIDGITIDYVRQGLNEGFEFINPNERDRCGCGESFRV
jgi:iron-sulfur cluster assembly protein